MGVPVFGNEFFDQWLNQKSNEILAKVEKEKISNEDMLILSLKAQVNHFHHMDIEFRDEFKTISGHFNYVQRQFEQVDKKFDQVDKRFEQVDKRFEQVDKRFEQVDQRFEQVDKSLDRIRTVMMWGFGFFVTLQMSVILKLYL